MWVVKTRGPSTAWFDPTKRDRTTALRMTGFEWMTEFKRMTGVRRMTRTSGSAARLKGALFQKRLSAGRRECHPVRGGMGAAPPFGRLAGAPAGGASPARAGDRVREHQADQFPSASQRTYQGGPCRVAEWKRAKWYRAGGGRDGSGMTESRGGHGSLLPGRVKIATPGAVSPAAAGISATTKRTDLSGTGCDPQHGDLRRCGRGY